MRKAIFIAVVATLPIAAAVEVVAHDSKSFLLGTCRWHRSSGARQHEDLSDRHPAAVSTSSYIPGIGSRSLVNQGQGSQSFRIGKFVKGLT
jgi:hypothetical protein